MMHVSDTWFWLLAFLAGIVSFTSPCCLPLLPGYLSYISGVSGTNLEQSGRRVLPAALLFVLGFAIVFTSLGATASLLGSFVLQYRVVLLQISGIFVIVMGLVILGVFRVPVLLLERRFQIQPTGTPWGALPLGMAFAFGWTPCVGPVLASILTVAAVGGSVRSGALLLFVYALGLGLPFILVGIFIGRGLSTAGWLRRHYRVLNVIGGSVLVAMGILLLTRQWVQVMGPLLRLYAQLNWPPV